jgi:hypothetical protein
MIGNTSEASSAVAQGQAVTMLRVWFSCIPFVLSEHDVKMTAALEVCTKDKKHATVRFLVYEGMKRAEIHRQLVAKYGQNCLPQ